MWVAQKLITTVQSLSESLDSPLPAPGNNTALKFCTEWYTRKQSGTQRATSQSGHQKESLFSFESFSCTFLAITCIAVSTWPLSFSTWLCRNVLCKVTFHETNSFEVMTVKFFFCVTKLLVEDERVHNAQVKNR